MPKFRKKTEDEIKREQENKEEIRKRINLMSDNARALLASEQGFRYRESIDKGIRDTIKILYSTPANPDPIKDAYFLRNTTNKIGHLCELLEEIRHDAKKQA